MYATLFQAITEATSILQEAQRQTEEMYIDENDKEKFITRLESIAKNYYPGTDS